MVWVTLAWAVPAAGLGFEAPDGGVVWDAVGVAHGCASGLVTRGTGLHGGAILLEGGRLDVPMTPSPEWSVGLQLQSLGDGVVWESGDVAVEVRGGRLVVGGLEALPVGDGGWHHVVVGDQGGQRAVWVDGLPVVEGPAVGSPGTTLAVGQASQGGAAWTGWVDDLTVSREGPSDALVAAVAWVADGPTDVADCGDRDGDGLDDAVEIGLGTDPESLDSDLDSFLDAYEVGDPTYPVDTDGDGLIDALDPDDDGDGLDSLLERVLDADGDGAPDLDPDGDGLENGIDLDSDDDGVPDGVEGFDDGDGDGIADVVDPFDDPLPTQGTSTTDGTTSSTTVVVEEKPASCGCAMSGAAAPWWGLATLFGVARRRRSTRAGSCRR